MSSRLESLAISESGPSAVDVHMVVLLSILDQHSRRSESQDRAIGVLLGTTTAGVVEITNSFGVFHVKKEAEVLVRRAAVTDLLALHKRVNDKETIVGWYSTVTGDNALLDDISLAVHAFFTDFCPRPVHLAVDTRLVEDRVDCRAYVTQPNSLTKDVLVAFSELRVGMVAAPEARVGIDAMLKATAAAGSGATVGGGEVVADLDALQSSMRRLKGLLDGALAYVDGVVAGARPADESVGRALAETLNAVPTVDAAGFDRAFTASLRNLLMTAYLASITTAQMRLAEKITSQVPQATAGAAAGGNPAAAGAGTGGGYRRY